MIELRPGLRIESPTARQAGKITAAVEYCRAHDIPAAPWVICALAGMPYVPSVNLASPPRLFAAHRRSRAW